MSGAADLSMRIDRDTAIDMAVYSGNLLYGDNDEAHAWALTVITSNLFELIGEGDTSADRFADGFAQVSRLEDTDANDLGWDTVSVARAIRNWIDHGFRLDRPQEMNMATRARVNVSRVAFIRITDEGASDDVYRVYLVQEGSYELHFSPANFWSYVMPWYEGLDR